MRLRAVMAKVLRAAGVMGRPESIRRTVSPLSVGAGLVPDRLQLGNSVLQHRVGEVDDAVFDRVVKSLELGVRFCRALVGRCARL